jgi:hypothetical protein
MITETEKNTLQLAKGYWLSKLYHHCSLSILRLDNTSGGPRRIRVFHPLENCTPIVCPPKFICIFKLFLQHTTSYMGLLSNNPGILRLFFCFNERTNFG